jgi:drug/metabolite transporter (DMT)-like permease
MTARILLLILASVALSGLAQVSFKLGVSSGPVSAAVASGSLPRLLTAYALSPGVIAGLAMYGIGTVVWLGVLARTPLSIAYPFVGLSFIITATLGFLMFGETLTAGRVLGTALVIGGVVLVGRA